MSHGNPLTVHGSTGISNQLRTVSSPANPFMVRQAHHERNFWGAHHERCCWGAHHERCCWGAHHERCCWGAHHERWDKVLLMVRQTHHERSCWGARHERKPLSSVAPTFFQRPRWARSKSDHHNHQRSVCLQLRLDRQPTEHNHQQPAHQAGIRLRAEDQRRSF